MCVLGYLLGLICHLGTSRKQPREGPPPPPTMWGSTVALHLAAALDTTLMSRIPSISNLLVLS
jgi:hypothetical protein